MFILLNSPRTGDGVAPHLRGREVFKQQRIGIYYLGHSPHKTRIINPFKGDN